MRIGFVAPLKSPFSESPSGDRTLARLFFTLLKKMGHQVEMLCDYRIYSHSAKELEQKKLMAEEIYQQLIAKPCPFDMIFTYHIYHKAPDFIGYRYAKHFDIDYFCAESSLNPKQKNGEFSLGYHETIKAIESAKAVVTINPKDIPAISKHARVASLPLFLDEGQWRPPQDKKNQRHQVQLLIVAMMRQGDKLESYRFFSQILPHITVPFHCHIVGGGNAEEEIHQFLAAFADHCSYYGVVSDQERLQSLYRGADYLVMPAINEALGMVFLEAMSQNCPSIALNQGGVSSVIHHQETGMVFDQHDPKLMAEVINQRAQFPNCHKIFQDRHNMAAAANIMQKIFSGEI